MINIEYVRDNPEKYKKVCEDKGIDLDVDKLLNLDKKRRELIQKTQKLEEEKNKLGHSEKEIKEARKIKKELKPLSENLKETEKEYEEMMLLTPNIYSPDTPKGEDEESNEEKEKWGELPDFDFEPKSHIELGKELDIIDFKKGVKTSGFRGYYLKNEGVLLHYALLWHSLLKMVKKGFTPMLSPTILRGFALTGSGHFPFLKDSIYQIANPGKLSDGSEISEPMYLAGTSEPALLAYFSDTTIPKKELPKKVCAFTPCYRSEVGSYGKDTKGLFRVHEFMKVEQVVLCENDLEESNKWLEKMLEISRELLEELKLPHQVVEICTGDMGAGKYKMYDVETWMPSRNSYGETHSDSNITDWQARRLNIKYRNKDNKREYAHTLNNTVLASPRILIALLENYQNEKGEVEVPEVLQKYLDFKKISKK